MQSSIALPEALDVDDLVERHLFWFGMLTIYAMTMNTYIEQLCINCIQYNRIVIYTYFMLTLSKYF